MLLNHTSGVAAGRGSLQLYRQRDALAWAQCQTLAEAPGTTWRYNNVGIFLAASAAAERAGMPLASVANERLFAPLCITDAHWAGDRRAHTFAAGDLQLRAVDLARLGHLVLERGAWQGRQLVSAEYVDAVTRRQGGSVSTLINLYGATGFFARAAWDSVIVHSTGLDSLRARGVAAALTDTLATYAGRTVETTWLLRKLMQALGTRSIDTLALRLGHVPITRRTGPAGMIYHDGDGGQYLAIFPSSRLVVVRQRRLSMRSSRGATFPTFYDRAISLHNSAR